MYKIMYNRALIFCLKNAKPPLFHDVREKELKRKSFGLNIFFFQTFRYKYQDWNESTSTYKVSLLNISKIQTSWRRLDIIMYKFSYKYILLMFVYVSKTSKRK